MLADRGNGRCFIRDENQQSAYLHSVYARLEA